MNDQKTKSLVPFKSWLMEEAERLKCSTATIFRNYRKGQYSHLKFHRKNPRVIYVEGV